MAIWILKVVSSFLEYVCLVELKGSQYEISYLFKGPLKDARNSYIYLDCAALAYKILLVM